jgi:sigma-B regulation protein RsbU (phosphoserine phosphatase)
VVPLWPVGCDFWQTAVWGEFMKRDDVKKQYEDLLSDYLLNRREDLLYAAQQLSKWMIEQRISPEEIVSLHAAVIKKMVPDVPQAIVDSFDMLIEIMMGYGIAYREHESLVHRQQELEYEIEVAVGMQQTLLPETLPTFPGIDIGVISVPANKMSGDYYNVVDHGRGKMGVALSDIIGKGIPAALCMSMIKYAMDGLQEGSLRPSEILRRLNSVVERNVDPSMFITMVYGIYNTRTHRFFYATAGHEPGLVFRAKERKFENLPTRGLVLGVSPDATYTDYAVDLSPGDAIILFSDGVTECRVNGDFLGRENLRQVLISCMDLPAQKAVEAVYQQIYRMAGYELNDDQTLMIIRRK